MCILKYFQIIVVLLLFSSCAIHAGFPFICFRAECIKNMWTLGKVNKPDTKAFKKRMMVKTKMLKRKIKNNKTLKAIKFPELPFDTTQTGVGNSVVYTRFILLFRIKKQTGFCDTMIVSYSSQFKDILMDDKDRLAYLLQTLNPGRLEMVIVREIINKRTEINEPLYLVNRRNRTICRFLRHEGISRTKVKLIYRETKART
jgi:hypothetical protein